MRVLLLLLLLLASPATGHSSGLSLEIYNNTQTLGTPHSIAVIYSSTLDLGKLNGVLSLRLQGTWTPNVTADYVLHCSCAGVDHLLFWVDDHMLCDTQAWTGWQGAPHLYRYRRQACLRQSTPVTCTALLAGH